MSQAHFGSTVPRKNSAFWKYCSRKKRRRLSRLSRASVSQAHFGSTVPGKNSTFWKYCYRKKRQRLLRASAGRWPNFTFFYFYFSGDCTSIFPGTVLPFCYFSVVRKVTEKPVLFLPHPMMGALAPFSYLVFNRPRTLPK